MFRSIASRSLLVVSLIASASELFAAVTTVGAVPNAPPAGGGAVVGTFTVGEGAYGSVTVTGGTPITNTGGAILGNLADGIGVVSLNGFGSDWTLASSGADLTIADEGVGQLTIANLAKLSVNDDTFVGQTSTGNGKLTVTGLGSLYTAGDMFVVGVAGTGLVEVLAGGGVVSEVLTIGDLASGQGTINVSGDLSRWTAANTVIGDVGNGRLEVNNRGRFTTSGTFNAGVVSNSGVGTVEVSGIGSSLVATGTSFTIGNGGSGAFSILNGAQVRTSSSVDVASGPTSFGVLKVDGAGSLLSVTGNLSTVNGEGTISVSNGGVVATTTTSVISSTGRLVLEGGRWQSTASSVGLTVNGILQGSGTIDVPSVVIASTPSRGRLLVSAGDRLQLTGDLQSVGLVELDGGELEMNTRFFNGVGADIDARNGAILRVNGTGLDNNIGAQLSITGGSVDIFGAVVNKSGAEIAVVGGSTAIFHDTVTNSGTIFVSASSEIALLENLSFVPSSALSIQLASSALQDPTEEFGLVDISGAASLAGGINVSLAAGFTPVLGDTFEILQASGGRTGTFATESLPTLGGGLALDVQYTANSVILAVVATAIPGDYNANGVVDAADYTRYRDTLGTNTTLPGDTTPGTVTAADYTVWKNNFGATASAVSAAAVPEPNTIWLVVLMLVCAARVAPPTRGEGLGRGAN